MNINEPSDITKKEKRCIGSDFFFYPESFNRSELIDFFYGLWFWGDVYLFCNYIIGRNWKKNKWFLSITTYKRIVCYLYFLSNLSSKSEWCPNEYKEYSHNTPRKTWLEVCGNLCNGSYFLAPEQALCTFL